MTAAKFPDISWFSRQAVTLKDIRKLRANCNIPHLYLTTRTTTVMITAKTTSKTIRRMHFFLRAFD